MNAYSFYSVSDIRNKPVLLNFHIESNYTVNG